MNPTSTTAEGETTAATTSAATATAAAPSTASPTADAAARGATPRFSRLNVRGDQPVASPNPSTPTGGGGASTSMPRPAPPAVGAAKEVKVRPLNEMTLYVFTKLFEPAPRRVSPGDDVVHMENAKGQMVPVRLSPEKVLLFGFITEWNQEVQRSRRELLAAARLPPESEQRMALEDPDLPWDLLLNPVALEVVWEESPVNPNGGGVAAGVPGAPPAGGVSAEASEAALKAAAQAQAARSR